MSTDNTGTTETATPSFPHPLDPASSAELELAARILRDSGQLGDRARFSCGFLEEPTKEAVRSFSPGGRARREVRILGWDGAPDGGFDAVVSLADEKIVRCDRMHSREDLTSDLD